MSPKPFAIAVLTLLGPVLEAQPVTDWQALPNVLPAGTRIRVDLPRKRVIEGTFAGVSATGISLIQRSGGVTIDRPDAVRIYRLQPGTRRLSPLIGAVIGAGAGTGAGMAVFLGNHRDRNPKAAAWFGIFGTGIGALIGHATRHRTDLIEVYSKY